MTGIKITLVRFALEQDYDYLSISQQGAVVGRVSSNSFTDLPTQVQVPFTLGPGDLTVDFTSNGRGLHSSTLQLNLSR